MKTTTRKLRSPLKWHGGKSYLARRIVALFPPHRVYVEPFIGGGSVLLNKPPAEVVESDPILRRERERPAPAAEPAQAGPEAA